MLGRPPRAALALLLVLLAVALALPFVAGPYGIKFATRVLVLGIFVLSLDLLIGISGLVSFGHAMFFGLGAYALYFLSPTGAPANAFLAFPLAMLGAGFAAAAVGALAVRTRGFYFIMVTLAFGEMTFALFHDARFAGGSDGAYLDVKPAFSVGGVALLDLEDRRAFYFLCLALLVGCYLALLGLCDGPLGRVLQGIRRNEERMGALGFNPYAHKLAAFTIAGALAGLAGALFAAIDGYVTPELFGWRQSGAAIMMLVLGGAGTLYGAVLGVILYAGLEDVLKSASLVGALSTHWSLGLGVFLVAAVLLAPRGLAALLMRGEPERAGPLVLTAEAPTPAKSGLAIETRRLTRRFGALAAVDDVTLRFEPGRVHGVIGPNGAGKTTFINLLSGAMQPSGGRILLDGEDVTGAPPYAMARRGVGRSYQITNVLAGLRVRDNCLLAAQARHPSPLRLRAGAHAAQEIAAVARALAAVGLADRADVPADALSHGEQRQLEIAMLLACGARVLLFDEPLAGMGPEETARVTHLIRALAPAHTIVLIEHDLDAVMAVADTLTVLVGGRLLAHGNPQAVRRDPAVRQAYLGATDAGP